MQAVLFRYRQGVGTGRRIGAHRTGGNAVQRIAQYVRKDHGLHPCRGTVGGKLPALEAGEPLADGVDFHDVRPAGQELTGDILQFDERDQRFFKQGASPAGEEKQHRIVLTQALRQLQRRLPGKDAVLIRNGMPRLITAQSGNRLVKMAVLADDEPIRHRHSENGQRRPGHAGRRLAGCDQKHAARKLFSQQRTAHRALRHHGVDGGIDGFFRVDPKFTIHP